MPHVIVKLWPGPTERQKQDLAKAIVEDLVDTLQTSEDSVSVAIEEIKAQDWMEKVYWPDIGEKAAQLYKIPGYQPF